MIKIVWKARYFPLMPLIVAEVLRIDGPKGLRIRRDLREIEIEKLQVFPAEAVDCRRSVKNRCPKGLRIRRDLREI